MYIWNKDPIASQFKRWMHRPIIDLGPAISHLYTYYHQAVIFAYQAVALNQPRPRLHSILNASAREAILRETGMLSYMVDHPKDVAESLRTPEWMLLCDALDSWDELSRLRQADVIWLLFRLGLQTAIIRQLLNIDPLGDPADEGTASLVLMRGMAKLSLCADGAIDLDELDLEHAATISPPGGWARLEATYNLASSAFRNRGDAQRGALWLEKHKIAINDSGADTHTFAKLASRYHRLHAFVHQFSGNHEAMSRDMALAGEWLDGMDRSQIQTEAEWYTLRAAYLESSVKESFIIQDFDRAEQFAQDLVSHTPHDPRSWMELGQTQIELGKFSQALGSYRKAVFFGPPGTEVAQFMMGQCFEAMGDIDSAVEVYMACLSIDPQAICAFERLVALKDRTLGGMILGRWAESRFEVLCAESESAANSTFALPYQQYNGVLGAKVTGA